MGRFWLPVRIEQKYVMRQLAICKVQQHAAKRRDASRLSVCLYAEASPRSSCCHSAQALPSWYPHLKTRSSTKCLAPHLIAHLSLAPTRDITFAMESEVIKHQKFCVLNEYCGYFPFRLFSGPCLRKTRCDVVSIELAIRGSGRGRRRWAVRRFEYSVLR